MKTYYCVDKDGSEWCSNDKPARGQLIDGEYSWFAESILILPKGTIKKITGKPLTWEDEPIEVEIK
jgi:hypothetical protein